MRRWWLISALFILLAPTAVLAATAEPNPTAVRLSELMPAPPKGENEWIELTNPSEVGELLDGWTIENGRGSLARLSGLIQPWGRVVITDFRAHLSNVGDLVTLKDDRGHVIDQVAYGGWPRGAYGSVAGAPKTGQAVARLELSDRWALTSTPTPGQANIFPTETPFSSAGNTPKAPVEKKKPAKAAGAKKLPVGEIQYDGAVVIPTGVYGKTRMYAVVDGALRELRVSRTPAAPPQSGMTISFAGQERSDASHRWLAVTLASLVASGTSTEPTFSATTTWPGAVAAVELTGTVTKIEKGKLWIQAGEKAGAVVLPSAAKITDKVGDVIVARGFASPSVASAKEGPTLYLTNIDGVALVKPASATNTAATGAPSLPGALSGGLTASVGGIGLLAYLRNEKLKRKAGEEARDEKRDEKR